MIDCFSFFGNRYDFSYFFLSDSDNHLDIEDEDYEIKDVDKEKVNCLNRTIDLMSLIEVFITMTYDYEKNNSSHCSTMRTYDSYLIKTKDFNLCFDFNLSICNRISSIKIVLIDSKNKRKFGTKNIVEFENNLEKILNHLSKENAIWKQNGFID